MLKRKLTLTPIPAHPKSDRPSILNTDASESTIGRVLSQEGADGEHVIAFGSRTWTKAEKRYSVTGKKLLTLVYFLKHFHTTICMDAGW